MVQFQQALERVRAGADVMPQRQLEKVIAAEAGPNWRSKVATFEDEPLAAASIGQVYPHRFATFLLLCKPVLVPKEGCQPTQSVRSVFSQVLLFHTPPVQAFPFSKCSLPKYSMNDVQSPACCALLLYLHLKLLKQVLCGCCSLQWPCHLLCSPYHFHSATLS